MFILPIVLLGQMVVIDSCGLNTDKKLNKYESAYFNESLKRQRDDFNFLDKKIGFAYGNYGRTIISKKEYFDRWGRDYYKKESHVLNSLIVLTPEEKIKSGGFDAVIISWSKIGLTRKHKDKMLIELQKTLN